MAEPRMSAPAKVLVRPPLPLMAPFSVTVPTLEFMPPIWRVSGPVRAG